MITRRRLVELAVGAIAWFAAPAKSLVPERVDGDCFSLEDIDLAALFAASPPLRNSVLILHPDQLKTLQRHFPEVAESCITSRHFPEVAESCITSQYIGSCRGEKFVDDDE